MKKYICLALLFMATFSLAQTDSINVQNNELIPYKKQLALDIEPAGVHLTYKEKVSKRVCFGVAIGGGLLLRLESDNPYSSTPWPAYDFIKPKFFIDIQITKRFHIYEACTFSLGRYYDDNTAYIIGYSIGIETGFFYRVGKKIELGFEPSLSFRPQEYNGNSGRYYFVSIPFLTLRVPFVKK